MHWDSLVEQEPIRDRRPGQACRLLGLQIVNEFSLRCCHGEDLQGLCIGDIASELSWNDTLDACFDGYINEAGLLVAASMAKSKDDCIISFEHFPHFVIWICLCDFNNLHARRKGCFGGLAGYESNIEVGLASECFQNKRPESPRRLKRRQLMM